jgi:hypothetical protein
MTALDVQRPGNVVVLNLGLLGVDDARRLP